MRAQRPRPLTVVAYPFHDWRKGETEGFRTRDGHLMQTIANDESVRALVVIDRPASLVERVLKRVPRRAAGSLLASKRVGGHECSVTEVSEKIRVVDITTPEVVRPAVRGRAWWFDVFARQETATLVAWALAACGASRAPAIAWVPTVAPLLRRMEHQSFVFDSLDNWLIHPVLRRHAALASAAYADLLSRADAVFASAPRSAAVFATWRRDVVVLPNGVDRQAFRSRLARPADLPDSPIVGYAGKLAHRIDTELVADTARRMPDVTFIFLGQVLEPRAVADLDELPNVRLLGDRHYRELPAYVQHFDVAWIPHRVGEGESGGDPIKLYEYWAAERPVVATPIDGMDRWAETLALVTDGDAAERAIRDMLRSPRVAAVPEEREWSAIAQVILQPLRESAAAA